MAEYSCKYFDAIIKLIGNVREECEGLIERIDECTNACEAAREVNSTLRDEMETEEKRANDAENTIVELEDKISELEKKLLSYEKDMSHYENQIKTLEQNTATH